jgi:hypothetical protein
MPEGYGLAQDVTEHNRPHPTTEASRFRYEAAGAGFGALLLELA